MKILFFSPHAAIWVHAFPEALVAESLCNAGHEIYYVTCDKVFRAGCVAMSAQGLRSDSPAKEKLKVCQKCRVHSRLLRSEFGFAGDDFGNFLMPGDGMLVRQHLARISRENYLDLAVDDIPVGKLALYEFLLEHKKSAIGFDDDRQWARYRVTVENALYTYYAGHRMLDAAKPDVLVTYNALYTVNRVVGALAEKRGIRNYSLHAGANVAHRLQTMIIAKGENFKLMDSVIKQWPNFHDRPVGAKIASEITDHFLELLSGTSVLVYSALFGVGQILLRSAAIGLGLLVVSVLAAYAIARNLTAQEVALASASRQPSTS